MNFLPRFSNDNAMGINWQWGHAAEVFIRKGELRNRETPKRAADAKQA